MKFVMAWISGDGEDAEISHYVGSRRARMSQYEGITESSYDRLRDWMMQHQEFRVGSDASEAVLVWRD